MKKSLFLFFTILWAALYFSVAGWGQEHPSPSPPPQESTSPLEHREEQIDEWFNKIEKEPDNFQMKFMNMLIVLALLVGFMVLASWMLKRMMRARTTQLNVTSAIKLLETRPLSPRATLYLIDVNGHTMVIAESPNGVTHLASLHSEREEDTSHFTHS